MNISFSEIDDFNNLDGSFVEINQNPYFNENITKNKKLQQQKLKSIIKKTNVDEPNENENENEKPVTNFKVQTPQRERKKGISYDDILSSMNTVVIDGKLAFIRNDSHLHENQSTEYTQQPSQNKKISQQVNKVVNFNQQQYQQHQQQTQQYQPQQIPQINPNDKNSYIFNKYFKDYKDPQEEQIPQPPLTRKQIIRQLLIDKVNRHNDQLRLSQLKSTKLLFNTNNNNIIRSAPFNRRNFINRPNPGNHLFKLKN